VTSLHEILIEEPVIGLEPTLPIIAQGGVSVIPVSDKIAYDEAVFRSTSAGPVQMQN